MIKLALFGAVAFLLGIGGGTGVLVLRAPALPPGADSTAAANAKGHAAPGAGAAATKAGHATAARRDSAAVPAAAAGEHAPAAAAEAAPDAHVAATPPSPVVVRLPVPAGVREGPAIRLPDAESYKSVGNILMNMKPVEAAKILAYLSDAQVEGLLRGMSPRNAATVLSQIPSERAAALSRRLLIPAPKEDH